MGEEFRNRLKHYDTMTDIVSGLINFRIGGTMTVCKTSKNYQEAEEKSTTKITTKV